MDTDLNALNAELESRLAELDKARGELTDAEAREAEANAEAEATPVVYVYDADVGDVGAVAA